MTTAVLSADSLQKAAESILAGFPAAVPTETVYGLCADALNTEAVRRVFLAKGRPEDKPISIFTLNIYAAEPLCEHIPAEAYKLAEAFWPGPLTMIFKRSGLVPDVITCGGDTVGIRVPDHPLALELLRLTNKPLTGTSANLSGEPSAVTFHEVINAFDGRIPCVVDGGKCPGGVASTVLSMAGDTPRILRQGALKKEDIERVLGREVAI